MEQVQKEINDLLDLQIGNLEVSNNGSVLTLGEFVSNPQLKEKLTTPQASAEYVTEICRSGYDYIILGIYLSMLLAACGVDIFPYLTDEFVHLTSEVTEDSGRGVFFGVPFDNLNYTLNLNNLTQIGDDMFSFTNIKTINAPNVEQVGCSAFMKCNNLTKVELPKCTYVGDAAFFHCVNLQEISLPSFSNAYTHFFGAFEDCKNLRKIRVPKSVDPYQLHILLDKAPARAKVEYI